MTVKITYNKKKYSAIMTRYERIFFVGKALPVGWGLTSASPYYFTSACVARGYDRLSTSSLVSMLVILLCS